MFISSIVAVVITALEPNVTPSIAPESILTLVVACEFMSTVPEYVVAPATVNAPTTAVVELATVACGVKTNCATDVPFDAISLPIDNVPPVAVTISQVSLASSPSSACIATLAAAASPPVTT